jgi:hypothetical protein
MLEIKGSYSTTFLSFQSRAENKSDIANRVPIRNLKSDFLHEREILFYLSKNDQQDEKDDDNAANGNVNAAKSVCFLFFG